MLPKLRGDFYEPGYVYLKDFPIAKCDLSKWSEKRKYDNLVSLVENMLETQRQLKYAAVGSDKKVYQQKAQLLDKEIDKLVYELYDLSEKEIEIIERDVW